MDNNRVFVVTGAASGIGKHLAKQIAARGHRVVATDLDEQGLAALHGESPQHAARILLQPLDVTRAAAWETAMDAAEKAFGPVDVVMNVAGVLKPGFVHEIDEQSVNLHIDVNVKGVIWGTRAAARRMLARGSGHIINFGSLASMAAVPGLCLYSASKFAVRGFSLAAAAELEPLGVAVTLVMPDAVKTPMLDLQVDYREAAMTFSGHAPLTVEDIEQLIFDKVLPKRPLEIAIPVSRGLLARLGTTVPRATLILAPLLKKKGWKAQEEIKKRR